MNIPNDKTLDRITTILNPSASKRRQDFKESNSRFVHYTSADSGLGIIRTKRMWMRNVTGMTDFREVRHGFDTLNRFFNSDPANRAEFIASVNACTPGAAEAALGLFDQWWNDIQLETYILSISEHSDSEDHHGRLSMWRAFGRSTARVALVFRIPLEYRKARSLGISIGPCAYFTYPEFDAEMKLMISRIRSERDFLKSLGRDMLVGMVFGMLVAHVVCLKHEGFGEEREWRVIHLPKRVPSSLMEQEPKVSMVFRR
jgi:hypothetical protein